MFLNKSTNLLSTDIFCVLLALEYCHTPI